MVWVYNDTKDRFLTPLPNAAEGFVCPHCETYNLDVLSPKVKLPCECIWHFECVNNAIHLSEVEDGNTRFTCPGSDCGVRYPDLRYGWVPVEEWMKEDCFKVPGAFPRDLDLSELSSTEDEEELVTYEEYFATPEPVYKYSNSPDLSAKDPYSPEQSPYPDSPELPAAEGVEYFEDVDLQDEDEEEEHLRSIYSEIVEEFEDVDLHEDNEEQEPWELVDRFPGGL